MQLAIVHYHLNRGGVTQVILNHLHALAKLPESDRPAKVVLLHGGQTDGWPDDLWAGTEWENAPPFELLLCSLPLLAYDEAIACEPQPLADAIHAELTASDCDPASTVIHTHNHALGKNASLPGALRLLVGKGYRLLLQLHDFAEDFRPTNYRHLMRATDSHSAAELACAIYPIGDGIHYAVLNGRDRRVMTTAGAKESQLHLLANPVAEITGLPKVASAKRRVYRQLGLNPQTRLFVYPVRGIRRKNVGELLLHGALSLAGQTSLCHTITLAPVNPAERVSFDRWQELADELKLPCKLGIGDSASSDDDASNAGVDFLDALAAADALITTSVAEGFGMVFLEAWLAGRPLVGRNLPEITADFVTAGICYDHLSDQLLVPTDWFDVAAARDEVLELHHWACRDFGVSPSESAADGQAVPAWFAGHSAVDFANLPGRFQVEVIRHAAKHPEAANEAITELNPNWHNQFTANLQDDAETIAANAKCVREAFSPAAIGRQLAEVYASLLATKPSTCTESLSAGETILEYFLQLDRLHPVRLEP